MKKNTKRIITIVFFVCFFASESSAWTNTKRLTWTTGDSLGPVIVIDAFDNLHLVYQDDTPGNNEIFYKQSSDGGATWAHQRHTWNTRNSLGPIIEVVSGEFLGHVFINLHMVWSGGFTGNYEVYYKRSLTGGLNWSGQRLSWTSGESFVSGLAIGIINSVHMVWTDYTPGNAELFYKKSTNDGTSWGPPKRLTWNSANSVNAKIATDSSQNLHMVWEDGPYFNDEIYYKKSTDGGNTWSPPNRLTWTTGNSQVPQIKVDKNDNLHVVWHDGSPPDFEIYYKKSTDGGTTWSPPNRLTWNSGASMFPAMAVDGTGAIHVVWMDDNPGNWEIFYKKSVNNGSTWTPIERISWNSGFSGNPSIAADSNNKIYIFWGDLTPGNWEIFYKKSN